MKPSNHDTNAGRRRFLAAGAIAAGGLVAGACGQAAGAGNFQNAAANAGNTAETPHDQPRPEPARKQIMKQGTLLTGGSQVRPDTGEKRWVFSQLNLDKAVEAFPEPAKRDPALMAQWSLDNARLITDIGFLAHGVIPHPKKPERILVFEKKGNGGCEIDLKENKVATKIPPSKGCEFYGHGGYSADAARVYATEYDAKTYEGKMVVRDAADFKILGEFPTYGDWPHDCQFIDGGKVVAVTNGGGHLEGGAKPCVTYVEVESGKLLEKVEFANPNINAGHLFINAQGDLAVLHAMREGLDTKEALGGLSLRPKGKSCTQMANPAEIVNAMKGETLSQAWHEKDGVIGVTNPFGNLISFWKMADTSYVSRIKLKQPRGIGLTLDAKYYAITFDKENPNLILVPADTRMPEAGSIQFPLACDGSHAYVYDWPV
jgi:hypothetical protein